VRRVRQHGSAVAQVQADVSQLWHNPQVVRGPLALQPPGTLWTVGHSTHPIVEFVDILTAHGVTRIADVRRFAGSRKFPQFNPDELERSLAAAGIAYTPLPALGGRRKSLPDSPHSAWRNEAFRGYADYMDTEEFSEAAESLARIARDDRVAAMCSEAVWWRCHRSMIADYFKAHGWEVLHIMGMGEAKEHPYTSVAKVVDGVLTY
jgi:uncharacterized protein (DUF488 family)